TLSHYETPYGLTKKHNGWLSRETIDCFIRYCEVVFNRYKDVVKYWLTFNEINITTHGGAAAFLGAGVLFDGIREIKLTGFEDMHYQECFQALHHQFVASAKAVQLGHSINPGFKIGCMIANPTYYPYS
ncbi:family 1 glycosylhydrolase, partial [Clostridium perfringens]